MYKFFKVVEFDAVGGPQKKTMGLDGFMETPTEKGRFVVGYIGKHRSFNRYGISSEVEWGTPLREHEGKVQVYVENSWIDLSKYAKAYYGNAEEGILQLIKDWNEYLPARKINFRIRGYLTILVILQSNISRIPTIIINLIKENILEGILYILHPKMR